MKTKMIHWLLTLLAVLSVSSTLHASETVTFFHHDALGSTIAATDENGDTLWTEEYTPYGNRIEQAGDGTNALWYTGKEEELGLNYSLARWYDPKVGRFLSIDPVNFDESNLQSFNRYAYANNNPYKYSDPDGNSPKLVLDFALNVTINILTTGQPGLVSAAVDTATNVFNPAATATKFKKLHSLYQKVDGNVTKGPMKALPPPKQRGNPNGAPENGTIFVDSKGNGIVTPPGGKITGSPDGRFIQARDANGNVTGVRKDGGHNPANHPDPRAQQPHGHVPGVTNSDGTPWLPINQ